MSRNSIAPGGYIGGEPPRRPYANQLSGVWKLDDVVERQKNNAWANPLGIEDIFSTHLYTGNGSTQTIANGIDLSGKGGLVWIKGRQTAFSHILVDTARGATKFLSSNNTTAEQTAPNTVPSFSSTGFTAGTDNQVNLSGDAFASWTFRKAEKFFDVVTYTGNGSNQNIAHNLGSAPGCIIIKSTSSATNWIVYHAGTGATKFLQLNQTNAAGTFFDYWNNTAPTSTQFTLGAAAATNTNGESYVAYLFAHDAGGFGDSGNDSVVKCGSMTNAAPVNLGWEPQFVLLKRTDSTGSWFLLDTMRGFDSSTTSAALFANLSDAEASAGYGWSLNATGFSGAAAGTYIYIAIRRGPMRTPTDATKVFSALTRAGTSATATVSSLAFSTDATLIKTRTASLGYDWNFFDRLRGATKKLATNSTGAESTETNGLNNYASMVGYTLGPGGEVNSSSDNFVNINFRRAPGFFDVVAYTGSGSAVRTIAHNLSVTPELVIIKSRSNSDTTFSQWAVGGSVIQASGANRNLFLNTTDAAQTGYNPWYSTLPTSAVFTVSDSALVNGSSQTYIAYLFASCPGVSKVGSYTGTGTTLSIDCGFTAGARFVLIKRTNSTGDWYVWDTARGIVSGSDPYLLLNSTAAEVTSTDYIDPLSSGFQISSTAPAAINANGGNYIFLAIA